MDHVERKEERDLETRLVRRDPLELARVIGAEDSQERSDAAGADQRLSTLRDARSGLSSLSWQLVELPDLFLERHLAEQFGDALLDDGIVQMWRGLCPDDGRERRRSDHQKENTN